jgi:hypothetical protein
MHSQDGQSVSFWWPRCSRLAANRFQIINHYVYLNTFAEEGASLKVEQQNAHEWLRTTVGSMVAMDGAALTPLLDAVHDVEREWVHLAIQSFALAGDISYSRRGAIAPCTPGGSVMFVRRGRGRSFASACPLEYPYFFGSY